MINYSKNIILISFRRSAEERTIGKLIKTRLLVLSWTNKSLGYNICTTGEIRSIELN